MTQPMRIKEVGATINLGNYSSLHITVGEPQEYAGLEFQRSIIYLQNIAKKVGGVLNLPEESVSKDEPDDAEDDSLDASMGEKYYSFGSSTPIWYNHKDHSYYSEAGVRYESVTQLLSAYYPFGGEGKIAQEYLDFAASYGNMIHSAIQNTVIGKPPTKKSIRPICDEVVSAMGEYDNAFVEQLIALPEQEVAGRFDIVTQTIVDPETSKKKTVLWDVKTNSDLYKSCECTLPDKLKEKYSEFWGVDTIYGEHCLQLNLYAYIIEKTGDITIDEIKIIHVPDGFKEIIDVPKVDVADLLSAYGSIR